ncbi:16S rRNA (uracil(1498)-N(3))-methyltransferase [Alpinimonas psychrophila]|uniref:Ribosomal RNA small subunit methyltransferase E n=1 Tax=Alpinimonas psychrophila TaxID=748908 RepID=A0A7W3JSV1_9MICO|nr:16S rRNA (uracil(1498)-N(3))-methyltransferase [Alpinimonas psychrophila]MBA8828623.1 16S rRNA (uracil1498-N3)-methyltransferase [Alpinimonas psychrophila]
MAHFYLIDELVSTVVGELLSLRGSEGRHAATVSRVRVGESLLVGNGRGLIVSTTALTVEKDVVTLEVTNVDGIALPTTQITLVQALAKNDRDERAVEACTELGIDAILPWAAERSISKWEGPKVAKGRSRWGAIVREATKQSIRAYIPEVLAYEKASVFVKTLAGTQLIVLDPTGDVSLGEMSLPVSARHDESTSGVALSDGAPFASFALIVGPEGGITPSELALLRANGATIATLGKNILRTSTAGPAALAILSSRLRRL